MPIYVNTNYSSLNAQRRLAAVDQDMEKALQRLASGLRINSAGDDAAGLAIATGLDTQQRGVQQAIRNARDGLSVVSTVEGSVSTQTEILQRMRELAVQSANETNSADNRRQIQQEIDALKDELTRIANTTQFNGIDLMNGTFTNKKLQVGAFAHQTIDISLNDFRAGAMGHIAQLTGYSGGATGNANSMRLSAGPIDGSQNAGAGFSGVRFDVESVSDPVFVGVSESDGVSSHFADSSAIAKANAINEVSGATGVTASVNEAKWTSSIAVAGAAGGISAATQLQINGVTVVDGAVDNFIVGANDNTGSVRAHINAHSNETGVVASLNGAGNLVLTAADGRNIIIVAAGTGSEIGVPVGDGTVAANFSHQATGVLELTSNDQFTVTSDADAATNLLGLSNTGVHAVGVAVDPNKAINMLDVTTYDGSQEAIQIIDSALDTISSSLAELGALTNRIEQTISNLSISIENLAAAESRIRDADYAEETSNLVRTQIIRQASSAALTQANLKPQVAITLLNA